MSSTDLTSGVKGKTIRFSWIDGPTKGMTHEHVFHEDGTVEWHRCDVGEVRHIPHEPPADRPKYSDDAVSREIRLVSYLAKSGYTLTVVLNADDGHIAGVASNEKTWVPIHGSYSVVEA